MIFETEDTKVNEKKYEISIVIPILNAEMYIKKLITAIQTQKLLKPIEIILVDSGSTDNTIAVAKQSQGLRIIPIRDFTHGRSRNLGAQHAKGEIIVFLTQDALPKNETWLYKRVAASYSRQIPRKDAVFTERFFLKERFPEVSSVKKKTNEFDKLTLDKVFFSNVSSAVRRSVLLEYPFDENLIMSEDQQLSRDLLNAGFLVVYAPESVVIHSHNYTLKTVFKRYFDSVFSLTEIFPSHDIKTSIKMGFKYLSKEVNFVIKNYPHKIGYYILYTSTKVSGTLLGHFAKKMPRSLLQKLSLHSYHWK
jgi:rhamnosyltransferase